MEFLLNDGTGFGYRAKVDSTKRVFTRAVTTSELQDESEVGNGFVVSSGFVTFTTANPSAILYFKNDGENDIKIDRILTSIRHSTGGTENHLQAIIYSNPTGMGSGSGTPAGINNTNFGSSNTLSLTSEVGQEGATITGGGTYGGFVLPLESLISETTNIILPKGSSIGMLVIPPTGNTSIQVGVGLNVHISSV